MAAREDIVVRRKRLRFRAWHRGTREMDLILGPFADSHLEGFDTPWLDRFETLLELDDPALLKWMMGQEAPPASVDQALIDIVRDSIGRRAR